MPRGQQSFPGLAEERTGPPVVASEQPVPTSEPVAAPAALRKVAVYLEDDQDAALEALRYQGTSRRPRLDVSKSAVVRLALERLLTELSHEQIVETIAARPTDAQATGRKRR